jgi:hypothetical protein
MIALLPAALSLYAVAAVPTITPAEAARHVGHEVVVQGTVSQIATTVNLTTHINFGGLYPNHVFTATIFKAKQSLFTGVRQRFEGKVAQVQGTVRLYRGKPEIVIDDEVLQLAGVDRDYIETQALIELTEIERRRRVYLRGRAPLPLAGATAIVVDDGIATGTTVRAALKALRRRQPARLVLAVPVAPHDTVVALRNEVDDLVCLAEPEPFHAIGLHYADFHQVSDDEVMAALDAVASPWTPSPEGEP